ncbi:phosphopyruvate hydratase [Streptomyces crystallinus]|uniref:Enolase n=2 Tax=Streptomyces crystallinus TaxID=68191 RepID=A0ABP3QNG6_9ACTN
MVEVEVRTRTGHAGRGASPTGQSVGGYEALVLRDNDPGTYDGLSVHRAVENVRQVIAPALIGRDVRDQAALDGLLVELDGTPRKSRLGGNAVYSVSVACLRAAAAVAGRPVYRTIARTELTTVPVPSFNVVNGGRCGDIVQAFNEFIVVPYRAADIAEAVETGIRVFDRLGAVIEKYTGTSAGIAPSYGYRAPCDDPRVVLELIQEAVDASGCADKVAYALDCASSQMYDSTTGAYELKGKPVSSAELVDYTRGLTEDFDIVFVEDLLEENDWDGFAHAVSQLTRTLVLGDDLIATHRSRLEQALAAGAVDGFVLKPNQVGTITEALETYDTAVRHGLLAVPSGRSGGVVDDIVMDLSVGLQVPIQKNGAPRTGERIEKLNFLLRAAENIPDCRLADVGGIVRF